MSHVGQNFVFAEIAVSPNNNTVNIYEKKGKDWVKIHELNEHSGRITGTAECVCVCAHAVVKL